MHKTRKSILKRFKITGSGKVMRRTAGKRHLLRKLSKKQRRRASKDKPVAPGLVKQVKVAAPGKF
jgi:large subunit ribosomal protein L35